MKPKTIIVAILLALLLVILFNNKEEASFWLFGYIRTSKLLILGVFFLLGVVVGGILFRRKNKHPKEYGVTNTVAPQSEDDEFLDTDDGLTDEDREFIRRD
ncbi:hypothetical protein GQF61_09450 [Sphingobacterium sp. DK4209]|uniref:DUF1049 domain-containing protein n=1 Tax=Sphingobacterium zhuxiongii TaxID=2662364 RepID=A0A5Q0QAB7_9SPHI|nr:MULTISPECIES: hypothetical protein [unclassified Sphingobacterium]MVZ66082.1 hypothetical protein [Sphingobacterium sp. DK4209]QGA26503.1 hypothetical protein GFH32_09280 [Sphingobacterium sp. dk4302]